MFFYVFLALQKVLKGFKRLQDKQEGSKIVKMRPNMKPKMAKMRPKMPNMRLKRPKMAKMRAKITKMRAKMAKTRGPRWPR